MTAKVPETIKLDRELAVALLDLVAYPPLVGNAAHAGVPWRWLDEIREKLDATDGRIGPGHTYNWRRAHYIMKRNRARVELREAEEKLDHARSATTLGIGTENYSAEWIATRLAERVASCSATVARRQRELDWLEAKVAAS